jgi:hypothetical protein
VAPPSATIGLVSKDQYYQCRMRRGNEETTGWIEARGAKVELLPSGELWEVDKVYDQRGLPKDVLKEQQLLSRHSLPSIEPIR